MRLPYPACLLRYAVRSPRNTEASPRSGFWPLAPRKVATFARQGSVGDFLGLGPIYFPRCTARAR